MYKITIFICKITREKFSISLVIIYIKIGIHIGIVKHSSSSVNQYIWALFVYIPVHHTQSLVVSLIKVGPNL